MIGLRAAAALAVLLCAICGTQAAAVEFFASNRYGIPLTPLLADQAGEAEWLLAIDSAEEAAEAGLVSRRRLSGPEGETREWRISRVDGALQEEELVDGQLIARLAYAASGELEREERYVGGSLSEVDHWLYRQRQPLRMTTVDAAGTVLSVQEYQLSATGRLRRVTFSAGDEPGAASAGGGGGGDGAAVGELALMFHDGRLVQERSTEVERHMVSRFLISGQRQSLQQWQAGSPVSTARWTYDAAGAVIDEVVVDHAAATRTHVDHDEQGRASLQRTWSTGGGSEGDAETLLEERWFGWSADGELLSERAVSDRGVEVWEYSYDANGARVAEQYSLRGALVRSTEYLPDDARTDTLYRNGWPALRVFWQGAERVGEELISDDG